MDLPGTPWGYKPCPCAVSKDRDEGQETWCNKHENPLHHNN